MRIVISHHHHLNENQGAPGSVLALAREYRNEGHDVQIIDLGLLPKTLSYKAQVLMFPEVATFALWRTAVRRKVDIIDGSTGDTWLLASILRYWRSRPTIVVRSHGLEHAADEKIVMEAARTNENLSWRYFVYHAGYHLWRVRRSLLLADMAMFLNREEFTLAVKRLGLARDKARLVREGIPHYLLGHPLSAPPPAEGPIKIAYIARFSKMKGRQYAALALSSLLARYGDLSVSLLGTDCPVTEVVRWFDTSFHPRLTVHPSFDRKDLPQLLEGHQILLFTSLTEGAPKAVLEGMALGLVPIAFAIPGVVDELSEEDSILVPPRDVDRLVEGVDRLISRPELFLQLRRKAWEKAQEHGWNVVAKERLNLYGEAIDRRERAALAGK